LGFGRCLPCEFGFLFRSHMSHDHFTFGNDLYLEIDVDFAVQADWHCKFAEPF
jgi:hypothetical protein